jgi:hypothetical protein
MASIGLKLGEDPFTYEKPGEEVRLHFKDGKSKVVNMNDEIYLDGKWIKVSSLSNNKVF